MKSQIGIPLEILNGWDDLVGRTVDAMREIDPDVKFDQIKEKFGELRIYYTSSSPLEPLLAALTDAAGKISVTICERCGQPGELAADNYWWRTLCAEHRRERQEINARKRVVPQ